jgi:hypothetical protein
MPAGETDLPLQEAWSWRLTSNSCHGYKCEESYLHTSLCLHGAQRPIKHRRDFALLSTVHSAPRPSYWHLLTLTSALVSVHQHYSPKPCGVANRPGASTITAQITHRSHNGIWLLPSRQKEPVTSCSVLHLRGTPHARCPGRRGVCGNLIHATAEFYQPRCLQIEMWEQQLYCLWIGI